MGNAKKKKKNKTQEMKQDAEISTSSYEMICRLEFI